MQMLVRVGRMNNDKHRTVTIDGPQLHEMKNRLTVVKGIAQLLGRQVRRPNVERERLVRRVDELETEVVRFEEFLNGLTINGTTRGRSLRPASESVASLRADGVRNPDEGA